MRDLHFCFTCEFPCWSPPPSCRGHNAGARPRTLQYWQSQLKMALLPRHNKMMRQVPLFGVCTPRVELLLLFLSWSANRCCIYYPARLSCATAPPYGGRQRCNWVGEKRLRGEQVKIVWILIDLICIEGKKEGKQTKRRIMFLLLFHLRYIQKKNTVTSCSNDAPFVRISHF